MQLNNKTISILITLMVLALPITTRMQQLQVRNSGCQQVIVIIN